MKMNFWSLIGIGAAVLILAGKTVMAEAAPEVTLLELAKSHFTNIKPAEQSLFENFFRNTANGTKTDCSRGSNAVDDPANAGAWAEDRVIRAEWLSWLCRDPQAATKVPSFGIEIAGARIDGRVDLSWAKIVFPLRTFKCAFTGKIDLNRAFLVSLYLQGTYIKDLDGDSLTVERDIFFGDGFRGEGQVWLRNVTVGRNLECDGGQFINPRAIALSLKGARAGSIYLGNGFKAEGEVWLEGAIIDGNLECDGGKFINPGPGAIALSLQDAKVNSLYLRGSKAEGEVRLQGATIGGNLECDGGKFINPQRMALNLAYAKTGSVYLREIRAEGEVWLQGAAIGGNLECDGGQFINGPQAIVLDLKEAKVGSVHLRDGFTAKGLVSLQGATLGGNLECGRGRFINPGDVAINALATTIQGSVLLTNHFEAEGKVTFEKSRTDHDFVLFDVESPQNAVLDLSSAKVNTLLNQEASWPTEGNLFVHGFIYQELSPQAALLAPSQIKWIRRERTSSFTSQPYDQLAIVFRNMGYEDQAKEVMIAKNEEHGGQPGGFGEFFWYHIFGRLIGFSYEVWNALYLSFFVILVGYVLFRAGKRSGIMIATKNVASGGENLSSRILPASYPKFNAFVYSLETFVPLVKLGLAEYWMPNANRGAALRVGKFATPKFGSLLRCYLWLHIIAGWILTTLWVGRLTGLLKT